MAAANLILLPCNPTLASSSPHPPLTTRLSSKTLLANSSLRSIFSLTSSNPRHHLRTIPSFETHTRIRHAPTFAVSLSAQDLILAENDKVEGEEETDDAGNWRGFDWGQQEELLSNEEAQGGEVEKGRGGFSPTSLKLFVGNLPFGVGSEELAQLFSRAGELDFAEVIYNKETDQSRGFGFVAMCDSEGAEKAVDMFHQYEMDGRLLTVNKASPRGSRPIQSQSSTGDSRSHKIYVGNLPWKVDKARLGEIFAEHGEVVDVRVVCDQESGRSRGFGFVRMSLESKPEDVIAALDGKNLDGRPIRVELASQRP